MREENRFQSKYGEGAKIKLERYTKKWRRGELRRREVEVLLGISLGFTQSQTRYWLIKATKWIFRNHN